MLIENSEALIIDPLLDESALHLLIDKKVNNITILPTHEHYDHISGINALKKAYECKVIASEQCATNMMNPIRNASAHFEALFIFCDDEIRANIRSQNIQPYKAYADEVFTVYKSFIWNDHKIEIKETPGHSKGSVCIIIDEFFFFTGDSLIKGRPTITRLPGGSKEDYVKYTLPFLSNLPRQSIIFPGHGEFGYIHEFSDSLGFQIMRCK